MSWLLEILRCLLLIWTRCETLCRRLWHLPLGNILWSGRLVMWETYTLKTVLTVIISWRAAFGFWDVTTDQGRKCI